MAVNGKQQLLHTEVRKNIQHVNKTAKPFALRPFVSLYASKRIKKMMYIKKQMRDTTSLEIDQGKS